MANTNVILSFIKSADRSYAVVGDFIKYTLVISNQDTQPFINTQVYDILDSTLLFKEGSIVVDGISDKETNIFSGIQVGTILPNTQIEITFEAQVISTGNGLTENIATMQFEYTNADNTNEEIVRSSNEWEIKLYRADLEMTKTTDKQEVNLGDILTYTATVRNIGDLTVNSVHFTDIIPPQTELVEGSVKVGDNQINGVDLAKGILIGNIEPAGEQTITYQVRVIRTNCSGLLKNYANATFRYKLPDGSFGVLVGEPVLVVNYTQLTINTFKQISIESYLTIPDVKPCIETINLVTGNIDIVGCHVIETPQVISEEGQHLTGYKLVIHGNLIAIIEYTALEERQSVHSAHYTVPFSTFVILPPDYMIGSKLDISGLVEDIYYETIDIRNFFINVTTLINVKILGC